MRKDQHRVTVIVDGKNLGVFDVLTGGETDSDELKYKPGGMAPLISLGGVVTVGQLIVSRLYRLQRDHLQVHWLLGRVGKGNVVVNKAVLDPDGNAFGKPLVTKGVLKRVTPPEVDSNATGDAAVIELEITPEGVVT
jgi:hypothetical protein